MIRKTIIINTAWVIILLSSCSNNKIVFDLRNQVVKSCNGQVIGTLHIVSEDQKETYMLIKLEGKEGVKEFRIKGIDPDYVVRRNGQHIPLEEFVLKPNTIYTIDNLTSGDAHSTKIKVRTDLVGNIIYSNAAVCR